MIYFLCKSLLFLPLYSHCTSHSLKAKGSGADSVLPLCSFSLSHAPLLLASNLISSLPDHNICRLAPSPLQSTCHTTIIHAAGFVYNMTDHLQAPNHTTFLMSVTLHSTHRHTRLESTCCLTELKVFQG